MKKLTILLFLLGGIPTGESGAATAGVECDGPGGGVCRIGSRVRFVDIGAGGNPVPLGDYQGLVRIYMRICETFDGVWASENCHWAGDIKMVRTLADVTWDSLGLVEQPDFDLWMMYLRPDTRWCVAVHAVTFPNTSLKYSYGTSIVGPSAACAAPISNYQPPPARCFESFPRVVVEFTPTDRMDIGTARTGANVQPYGLTFKCAGSDPSYRARYSVRLNMTPTSWSPEQIATSNPYLGVSVTAYGKSLGNKETFWTIEGGGNVTIPLEFAVMRDPNTPADQIATGPFQASGTLILTEP